MISHPRILGVPGGGLDDATWARNAEVARIGKSGEVRTAQVLDKFARPDNGVTVLHDLAIPIPGFTANIDHAVVSGSRVHLIDAKVWKPARYWTLGQKTRRGWERFEPAEKKTMAMAQDALTRYLFKAGVGAAFATPVLVIWPSSTRRPLKTGLLKVPGAVAMSGDRFTRYAEQQFAAGRALGIGGGKGKPADQSVVAALVPLLASHRRTRPTGTDAW